MILFHTALPFESKPIIDALKLKQVGSHGKGRFYMDEDEAFGLLSTGMGMKCVLKVLECFFDPAQAQAYSIDRLINIGIAGATDRSLKFGELFEVSEVQHASAKHIELGSLGLKCVETKKLITVNAVCSDASQLGLEGDESLLIDMEAYHLFDFVVRHEILQNQQVFSFKVTSDYADGQKIDMKKLAQAYDGRVTRLLGELLK